MVMLDGHQPKGDGFANGTNLLVEHKMEEALQGPCPDASKRRVSLQHQPTTPVLSLGV